MHVNDLLPVSFHEDENSARVQDSTRTPVIKQGNPARQSSHKMSKNERWLKTQSAHITSALTTRSSHPTTPTGDTPLLVTHNQKHMVPDAMESEETPPLPPRPAKLGSNDYKVNENSRRLNAMNVTIRRPLEELDPIMKEKLSKEVLLLRSGVTLRPGICPPKAGRDGEEQTDGGKDGSSGPSGSDEEDGLEPVSR